MRKDSEILENLIDGHDRHRTRLDYLWSLEKVRQKNPTHNFEKSEEFRKNQETWIKDTEVEIKKSEEIHREACQMLERIKEGEK